VENNIKDIKNGMDFTPKDTKFTLANLAIFILDKVIDYSLDIYKDRVHIPEEKKWRVAMKNEYFYSSFSLTSRKKNYAALKDIQEGVVFKKPKLDVKGLMFIKSVVNGNLGADVEALDHLASQAPAFQILHRLRRVLEIALVEARNLVHQLEQILTDGWLAMA
jgi:hypothetical protein